MLVELSMSHLWESWLQKWEPQRKVLKHTEITLTYNSSCISRTRSRSVGWTGMRWEPKLEGGWRNERGKAYCVKDLSRTFCRILGVRSTVRHWWINLKNCQSKRDLYVKLLWDSRRRGRIRHFLIIWNLKNWPTIAVDSKHTIHPFTESDRRIVTK